MIVTRETSSLGLADRLRSCNISLIEFVLNRVVACTVTLALAIYVYSVSGSLIFHPAYRK